MKKTKSVLQSALLGCALGFTGSGVNASVINVSLDVNDWVADPLHAAYQSPNQSKVATQEGLKVTNNGLRGPSGGQGAFVRTASTYNAQDAVVRYKWKAIDDIGVASYANYWNGFDLWTFGAQMTTTWSWAGSTVIPLDTWIYTEANVASDLSYYFNFSTSGYSDQGGFRSFTGVRTPKGVVSSSVARQPWANASVCFNRLVLPQAMGEPFTFIRIETTG